MFCCRPRWKAAAVVLPLVLAAVTASGQTFVTTDGGRFKLCDQTFEFMGFNVRGICHFGKGDALPYSQTGDVDTNLNYCQAAKARVIRVFCAYNGITKEQTGNRLQTILDKCEARGMYVIPALTDFYQGTQLHPKGDDAYYTNGLLNHTFYSSGYQVNYLPQVRYLVDRFKNHPAVFAWQIGNELRDDASPATFVSFCLAVAAEIRAYDPNHLVSAGIDNAAIATGNNAALALQLHGAMDFVNSHSYHGAGHDDSAIANALDKPYVIDEAGWDSNVYGPDRTPETNSDIINWRSRGVDGYMQWGLMATGYDNGDGDRIAGVDPVFHNSDFAAYATLFNAWATSFEQPATLGVDPALIERTADLGEAPSNDVFYVRNLGSGQFTFSVSESSPWLSISPSGGTSACGGRPITITYDTVFLPPGRHEATIRVEATGIAGSPQDVLVAVTVAGIPGDLDGDGDVDLEDFGTFQTCLSGPGIVQTNPACVAARLEGGDLDVDQNDVAKFIACLARSGPNIPADPTCAD